MKNLEEYTSRFAADATNTVTNKLFKKGERLYREGSYTLWRDDLNDYYVAYAVDERASTIMSDVRASVRGGKAPPADNTVNAKAQVLKILVTNEARLEFDIITQEVPARPCHTPVTPCFLSCSPLSPRRPCGRCAPRGEHISKRFVPHHDCVEPRNRSAPRAHTRQGSGVTARSQELICTRLVLALRSGRSSCRDGNREKKARSQCIQHGSICRPSCDKAHAQICTHPVYSRYTRRSCPCPPES